MCNGRVLLRQQLSTLITNAVTLLLRIAVVLVILGSMCGCQTRNEPKDAFGDIKVTTRVGQRPTPQPEYEIIRPFPMAEALEHRTTSTLSR
ncbi:MAG: hypothetical protein N2Z21_02950 [Candidatus Sumerlaeaceae bacterium]|nr:hypothetical protein [Candidatus Sumerlaeaceae bacterium]